MPETKNGIQWSISLRPQTLNDVYGQDFVKKDVYNRIQQGKDFPKAMLFMGRFGCGKTTTAKIIAKMIQCKNPKPNGDPCGECASCKSIENETFGRNTYMIDGGQTSKDDIIDTLTKYTNFPPMVDKKTVIILEEVQELSKKAKNSLLKMMESPSPNVYFLLTAMEDLGASGLTSRCQIFKFPQASVKDVAYYLRDCMKRLNLLEDPSIPEDFKVAGLYTIATNSNGSYRYALQLLEQCVDSQMYSREDIQKYSGIVDMTTFYGVMKAILDGRADEDVMETLINGDCENNYRLAYKVISDAESYRVFKKVPGDNEFFAKQAAGLAEHPNFDVLLNGFAEIQRNCMTYFNKNIYIISVCEMIRKCANKGNQTPLNETVVNRNVVQNTTPTVNRTVVQNNVAPVNATQNTVAPPTAPSPTRRVVRR